ncbi:MAG: oligosaccharide flippase family protein [Methylobacteriaceae bacterium]|nr:oligosaccharide flippase family protein [Methylobacteriaceae bacterium]
MSPVSANARGAAPHASPRRRLGQLGSSAPLLAANLLEALLPFVRNIALARLIAPDQFGLAISLSVVIGMIEVLTDFGLPIFAVRKEGGTDDPSVMATLQSLSILRGCVLGFILAALSPWIARSFHAEGATATYALLGLVVLVRAWENLGVKEAMRDGVFWREALVVSAAQIAAAGVTVAVAAAGGDFSCMVWGMLAAALATVGLSHVLSPRPFRLAWNREAARDASRFGRPLLVNGVAASLGLADRLLVGYVLGPRPLALYNVAYGTGQLPRTVLARFLTSAFLPLFVKRRDRGERGSALFDGWAWCLSCLAFVYGLGLSLVGDQVLAAVFGEVYRPSRLFMCLAGLSVCVKMLMLLPVPAAYAAGNTRLVARGSILSALSVLPGAALLLWRGDLELFLAAMTATEFVALLTFSRRAMREQAFTASAAWLAISVPMLLLAALAILTWVVPGLGFAAWLAAGLAALALSAALYGLMLAQFEIGLRELLRS